MELRKQSLNAGQKQHVQIERKLKLRRRLLADAVEGAAYCPYLGEGDIAAALYSDRLIYGVELQKKFLDVAQSRLRGRFLQGDCRLWHFDGDPTPFALADFDAYGNPYESFDTFWEGATKANRVVMFFCDGRRTRISRGKVEALLPSGERPAEMRVWRKQYNMWLRKYVLPWISQRIAPYEVIRRKGFYRGAMLHWGCVVERP